MAANNTYDVTPVGATATQSTAHRLLEFCFYGYMVLAAFAHMVVYIPGFAPALLVMLTLFALLASPGQLKWLFVPAAAVATMLLIDLLAYGIDFDDSKNFWYWLMSFVVFSALHENAAFFNRAKWMLVLYIGLHVPFVSQDPYDDNRLHIPYSEGLPIANANDLAYWFGFVVLVAIIEFVRRKGLWRLFYLAIAGGAGALLLATVSRSAMLFVVASLLVYMVFAMSSRTRAFPIIVASALLISALMVLEATQVTNVVKRFQERMDMDVRTSTSYSNRPDLLAEGARRFLENLWLGTGSSLVKPPGVNIANTPHNQFITLGVRYGLWPPLLLLVLWIAVFWKTALLFARRNELELDDLPYEFVVMTMYIFLISNVSNLMVLSFFATLYMTKILAMRTSVETVAAPVQRRSRPTRDITSTS